MQKSDYAVSISVVTYNSAGHIGGFLDSVAKHAREVSCRIFVIDNGSADDTVNIVKSKAGPNLTLIQSSNNGGFGAGHNLVLNRLSSKYHICANPDTLIKDDVISSMARYMDEHPDIGLLAPKILNPDGTTQVLPKRDPRLIYLLSRRLPFRFLKKYREQYEMRGRGEDEAFDIEFASGAFMFMRTEAFLQSGGFDERFFLYFEDADLTRRIRADSRVQYNPAFKVYHYWARAGGKSPKYFFIQVHSMIKYMSKWRNTSGN